MSDLLGIAGNAVTAYQLALGTVSNNIANVSTDGYTRQSVELSSGTPRQVGVAFIGTGVVFDRVKRQYDSFAEANLRGSVSELASQEPMVSYANRVIDIMGSETAGLTSSLDQFFGSARALTTDPASTVLRGEFFRDAEGLASRFGQIASQLDMVDTETREAVAASLGEVNTIAAQLAAVNEQLAKVSVASRQPSELLDQRDRLLRDLSELARIRTAFEVNGAVTVSLGGSLTKDVIVSRNEFVRVGIQADEKSPERIALVFDPYGSKPSPLTGVSSGKLAGLLAFREQVLETTRDTMEFLADQIVTQVNQLHRSGVDGYGQVGGDLFKIDASARYKSAAIGLAIDDPMRIAAAAQFRVIENATNTGLADATVTFKAPEHTDPAPLASVLVNNPHPSASKTLTLGNSPSLASVATVPAGLRDVTLYLNEASGNQQLQLITRDGRHLLGAALNSSEQTVLMQQPGMTEGATYSTQYLGVSGDDGYKDMNLFYGARAEQRALQRFDSLGNPIESTPAPALLTSGSVAGDFMGLAAGTLKLNGVSLPALNSVGGNPVQADQVASWLNTWAAGLSPSQGLSARAFNEIRIPADQLKISNSLDINGVRIARPVSLNPTLEEVINQINAVTVQTGVQAQVSSRGELMLTNQPGQEGRSITIGPSVGANALGIEAKVYGGQVEITRSLTNAAGGTAIEIGFGSGKPSDLAKLGLRTAVHIKGEIPDDVLAFVTDTTGSQAQVSAGYSGEPIPTAMSLRAQPMEIEIVSGGSAGMLRYRITDMNTQTVMAERELNPEILHATVPGGGIVFQGLSISFSNAPKLGDRFVLDGNKDGTGNNDNIRALAALQGLKLVGGTKTIGAAYIDQVNEMGNIARQASIAQEALTVVRDQAAETRDKVSGVNLDEEAASLIRFQQAYQASAKVMQTASQLFDAVLQIA